MDNQEIWDSFDIHAYKVIGEKVSVDADLVKKIINEWENNWRAE